MQHTTTILSKLIIIMLCLCSVAITFNSAEPPKQSAVLERNLLDKFNKKLTSLGKIGDWLTNGKYTPNIGKFCYISVKWISQIQSKYKVTYGTHRALSKIFSGFVPCKTFTFCIPKHPELAGLDKTFTLSFTRYFDGIEITGKYVDHGENSFKKWTIYINKEIIRCNKSPDCTEDIEVIKQFALYCSHFISFEKTDSKNHQFKWLKLLAEFDHHVANTSSTKMPRMPFELYKIIKNIHHTESK